MSEAPHYAALADALRERRAVIADRAAYQSDPAAHLERLKQASERIEALRQALPRPVPAELAHFLERASFDKALSFLEALSA